MQGQKQTDSTFRRLTTAAPPLIRFIVGIGILLAFLTSFILFSTTWTDDHISDTTKSITPKVPFAAGNSSVETFYHYPHADASRRGIYTTESREKQVSIRVRFTPMIFSETSMLEDQQVYVTEVGDDLLLWTILLGIWFAVLWLLSLLRTIVNIAGWGETRPGSILAPILNFITGFEDAEAADDFIDWAFSGKTGIEKDIPTFINTLVKHMKTMLRVTSRAVFSFVREGFFVIATAVIVTYMYITLQAFDGKCGSDNCMVQNRPYKQIDAIVVFSIVFLGRMLSGYNYKDADMDTDPDNNVDIIGALRNKRWEGAIDQAVTSAEKRIASTTVQSIACFGSIACSIATMWLLSASFRTIDRSRRHPWDAIIVFILILEIIYICLNALVFLLSSTVTLDKMFSNMKLYVEGKLFGALYFTCGAITIYMCSRMAVNMYGSADWNDTQTNLNWIQVKQLSPQTSHCHFIPQHVYDDAAKYNFKPTVCVSRGDCCAESEFHTKDRDSCGDTCAPNGHTTYTGLIIASVAVLAQVALGALMLFFGRDTGVSGAIQKGVRTVQTALNDRTRMVDESGFQTIRVV